MGWQGVQVHNIFATDAAPWLLTLLDIRTTCAYPHKIIILNPQPQLSADCLDSSIQFFQLRLSQLVQPLLLLLALLLAVPGIRPLYRSVWHH